MSDRTMRLQVILAAAEKFTAPFGKASKVTTALSADLKAARDRVRDLDDTGRHLQGFQKLEHEIVAVAQDLKKAKVAAAALEKQFDETAKPTKRLTNETLKAAEAVDKLEAKQRDQVSRLEQVRSKLHAAGVETGDMARAQDRLHDQVAQANRALDAQKNKLTEVAERQKRLNKAGQMIERGGSRAGKALAVGAAAGAGATAVALPLKNERDIGNEFDDRMTDIGQKADLGRAAREKLAGQLLETSRVVNQLPADLQTAADTLAGFGLDVPVAVRLTKPIGQAATAYKAEMEDLSKASFAAIDNLKVPADQVGQVLDVMAFAGKKGAFEIKDMAGAFPSLTANYQALGQTGVSSVADLAAALQIVRKGAGDSEEAANNLENVLQKIGSPETERKFAKLGVNLRETMAKAAKEGETPIEAIAEATNRALKGDLSKIGYLFEDAQVQKGMRPLIQNMAEFKKIRAEAMGAKGVVAADFADRMQGGTATDKQAEIALMQARLQFAKALAPVVTPLAQQIGKVASGFASWANAHPKMVGFLAKGAVWIGVFLAAIAGIALIVAPILAFIAALGAAAAALGTTIGAVAGTIGAVVAAIAAAVLAVIGIVKGWHLLAPIVSAAWNNVVERIRVAIAVVKALAGLFMDAGKHMMAGLVQGLRNGLGGVKDAIFDAGGKVIGWFKQKLGIHSPSRVFAGLGGFVMAGLDQGLQDGQGAPLARVRAIAGELGDRFQRAAPRLAANVAGVTALAATTFATQSAIAAPSIRPGAPPAASAPAITINITVQVGSGQDGAGIGQAIGAEVKSALAEILAPTRANASYDDGYT